MPALPSQPLHKADLRHVLALERSAIQPIPKHRAATHWATTAQLLSDQGLTPEGILVATKDPYLETAVTDWLLHFHLSSGDRSLWAYVVHDFLPRHPTFAKDELFHYCKESFTAESPNTLNQAIRVILKAYTDTQAIANNKFITYHKPLYSTGQPDLSNFYTTGYLLAKVWERNFKAQASVLVDQILDAPIGLASILGISNEQLRQQLDLLAKHNIIEQRSAKPHIVGATPPIESDTNHIYLVVRCWQTPLELLEKAYENDLATPNRPLVQSLAAILDDDDIPDFSKLLEWASELIALDGGSNMITRLAS
jgi:hypothetical protein